MEAPSDEWRRFGEARRRELVEKDAMVGGTSFHLNKKCRIQKYFQLAERVLVQFREMCQSPDSVEQAYVMGHRLMQFLSHALPTHPEYMNPSVSALTTKTFQDLIMLREQMDDLALRIDEDQLNQFITNDFNPTPDDESTDSSSDEASFSDLAASGKEQWEEGFVGWSFDLSSGDETPQFTDTDVSAESQERTASHEEDSGDSDEVPDSDLDRYVEFHDEEDSDDEDEPRFELVGEEGMSTSILHTIAEEDFQFETDSEAVDSWAQDGDSNAISGASSGSALTCDPARIAFREIMNRIPGEKEPNGEAGTPPPPPVPTNSPADERKRLTVRDLMAGRRLRLVASRRETNDDAVN